MNTLRTLFRRLLPGALAGAALSLTSCETYVADGYYGGGYGAGYSAPAVSSTVYVAPRPYYSPVYHGSGYCPPRYYSSWHSPHSYCAPAPCYTPRYDSGSCSIGYSSGHYGGGHYGGGHYGGHGGLCR